MLCNFPVTVSKDVLCCFLQKCKYYQNSCRHSVYIHIQVCRCYTLVQYLWMKVILSWHQFMQSDEGCPLLVEWQSWLSQQGPKDPMVQAQTWKYILAIDGLSMAAAVIWEATCRCDSSLCLCYITHRHEAGGNNSSVVVAAWEFYLSGQKEEESVKAIGAGEVARAAAGTKKETEMAWRQHKPRMKLFCRATVQLLAMSVSVRW